MGIRRFVALGLAAIALPTFAAAASLDLTAAGLGAGSASLVSCDADGFTYSYATTGGNVTAVTVSGIADPQCEGGELSLTLTAAGTSIGSGPAQTVPTDGDSNDNSLTLALTTQPDGELVDGARVAIAGP